MARIRFAYIASTMIALGALFGVLLVRSHATNTQGAVLIGETRIPVSIADTLRTRAKGLSGTPSLELGTGKLFIFDRPDQYAFWMKDMQYPLDIVWVDSDWKVVDITYNALPESYPSTFSPAIPAQYVLELNAGEAVVDNITIGAQLRFQN